MSSENPSFLYRTQRVQEQELTNLPGDLTDFPNEVVMPWWEKEGSVCKETLERILAAKRKEELMSIHIQNATEYYTPNSNDTYLLDFVG